MTRAELKTRAKQKLSGNWGWAVGLIAVFYVFGILLSFFTFITSGVVTGILAANLYFAFLHLVDGRKDDNIFNALFAGFRENRAGSFVLTWLLQTIFIFLWNLLLVVPGIIKFYSYSMSYYIVDDLKRQGKELGASEAITRSRRLMDGHKFELFVLDLSFLGWAILCIFTLGIGYLWLAPYVQATRAEFYRSLVAQNPAALAD
ncbi:DUF975 family protein [Streptococcus dentapri]|uniref:DUF975 family protein n=1 Tax=Streptococcus dentapri TaxID=573564 RepID=A0ABV8D1G6_9STRE